MAGQNVLLVDDDEDLRGLLREAFEDRGWGVKEAPDGLEALKILKKESFSVIVTDMIMPNMDGHSFVSRSKKMATCPIVCVSGTSVHLDAIKLAEIDAVFEKPFDIDLFIDEVQRLIRLKKKS